MGEWDEGKGGEAVSLTGWAGSEISTKKKAPLVFTYPINKMS